MKNPPPFPLPNKVGSRKSKSKREEGATGGAAADDQSDQAAASVVTCSTTAGFFHVAVMNEWGPYGAARFLDMVDSGYFNSKVGRQTHYRGVRH